MSTPLLNTKIYLPPARAHRVPRPRLARRLVEGLSRKLILISAPPGFGKTALLAECMADFVALSSNSDLHYLKFAWLSLDEGDNDPVRFLTYLIVACQSVRPALGASALALLRAPQPPPLATLLVDIINDAAQAPPFALILDDYQAIDAPAVHAVMEYLLAHLPAAMHLVIATRSDPPLRLAQERARGELVELRAADLRFTLEEATAFLNQVMHLQLAPSDVEALEKRTEGWIAGLQLAALSLQGQPDAGRFISAFTGSNRHIVSYLIEQVLDRQSAATQQFLLRTSILARFNARLCQAVARQDGGEAMLEHLDAANLFLIPLDDAQEWYRYHQLFAEVLHSRLLKAQPDTAPELHERASAWFEQHGFVADAIHHAAAGRHWPRAARLIRENGEALLKRSETSTLQQWLAALPEVVVRAQPWLCLWSAELCGLAHQLDAAERYLQDAERAIHAEPAASPDVAMILTQVRYLRTGLALNAGDLPRTIALARDALSNLHPGDVQMRGWLLLRLGTAYLQTGKLPEAAFALAESARLSRGVGDLLTALYAIDNLASVHQAQTQLVQAAALYEQALELFAGPAATRSPIMGLIHADYAEVLYEWNDLEGAQNHLADALELGEKGGLPRTRVNAYIQLTRVRLAQSDLPAARAALDRAKQLVTQYSLPLYFFGRVDACEVRLWLAEGSLAAAAEWAVQIQLRLEGDMAVLAEVGYLMLARILITQGASVLALALLARLKRAAYETTRPGSLIEILALQAAALHLKDEQAACWTAIEAALALAEPGGYVRTFVDMGEMMRTLIAGARLRIAGRPNEPKLLPYVDRLLAAFPPPAGSSGPQALESARDPQWSGRTGVTEMPLESLSNRELEILRLMAAGHTNLEIAAALTLAVGTVKKHSNNIFLKLGVRNRVQAVGRAREQGLLSG